MGFRFRKSTKIGPFRITASKSGLSYSVGVKGARITKRADGKTQATVSIPGTGISHVSTTRATSSTPRSDPEQAPQMTREEQMRDYYDMKTQKQGCGCAIALAVFMALLFVACSAIA